MPEGLLAPLRVVVQRSIADWLIVVATWLVVLGATTLVAVGLLYGDAVALTGLRQIIADQPPTATSVVVRMRSAPAALPDVEPILERHVGRILEPTGGELHSVVRSEAWALPGPSTTGSTALALFGAYDGIADHAELLEGSWPLAGAQPMQVAISRATADALGIGSGDDRVVSSQRGDARSVAVAVSGVWEPIDADDPYWRADRLELEGLTEGASFVTHGPFVVDREDLLRRTSTSSVAIEIRALPDFSGLAVDDVNRMRADTAALERRLGDALGARASFQVDTELDAILASADRSLLVSRSGVVLLTIQFVVLAGYALLLVAGLLAEQRRIETALLRSRGAGVGHVAIMSLLEAVILVVPAVLAAPWLALGVLGLLNVAGPLADASIRIDPGLDRSVLLATAGTGLLAVIGLVLPALGAGRGLAAVRRSASRQGSRSLAQRLGLDLALVVLAAVGLWQLRQYGAPLTETVRGTIGLDPLLVAAPAIGLLAGSILALRIVPLAAEVAERLLSARRGLVGPLGARQLSRRPLRYTRSALLLMLAASLGTFAGAHASTWVRSQSDQAAYRTGADVRVEVAGFAELPAWAIGQAYRSVDGVEGALPISTGRFDLQRSGNGHLLALDATTAADLVAFRPDLADSSLADQMALLVDPGRATRGVVLDGRPSRFAIEIDAALEALTVDATSIGFDDRLRGVLPAVILRDADGVIHHVSGSRLAVGAGAQRTEIDLSAPAGEPAYPLALLAVEIQVELPDGALATGGLTLERVEVAGTGDEWSAVDLAGTDDIVATAREPIPGFGAADTTAFRLPVDPQPPVGLPVPALASERYLELTGVAVGDVVDLGGLGQRRQFEIVGSLRGFPTLDPAEPFLVVDLATLASVDEVGGRRLFVDEWWLSVRDGEGTQVAATVAEEPYSAASVVAYDELHRELLTDPVALGVIGVLALGALAAVAFATIGFFVSATVSARERLGEFALLQAIGLSHRQLSAWISMENAFLLVIGLVAGTGLGLVMAWVVLPFVTLTQEATLAVPPVEVVVPWGVYGVLYLVAAAVLAVTVLVIGSLLGRVRVSGVLRSGGE